LCLNPGGRVFLEQNRWLEGKMFGWLVEMVWNEAGYVMVMVCY